MYVYRLKASLRNLVLTNYVKCGISLSTQIFTEQSFTLQPKLRNVFSPI